VRVLEENSEVLKELGDENKASERGHEAEQIRRRFNIAKEEIFD